jgi:HSP20 family protein
VEIYCCNQNRKYHRIIGIPSNADITSAKSKYNNGILEITFNKKGAANKTKGKEVNIE